MPSNPKRPAPAKTGNGTATPDAVSTPTQVNTAPEPPKPEPPKPEAAKPEPPKPAAPPAQLNLSAALAHAQLVNIAAQQLNSMKRVTPNNTAQSYLFHKVQGDQVTVGGSGGQMPAGQPQLTAGQRNDIQTWINTGAQP